MAADPGLAARLQQAGLQLVTPLLGLAALGMPSAAPLEHCGLAQVCLQEEQPAAAASGQGGGTLLHALCSWP